jgi:hypothetical protein
MHSSFADLLIVSLFCGLLFGFKLGERALWSPVEGHYSEIAREMVVSGDYLTPQLAGMKYLEKPPLFYWLESANIQWFGLGEWSLRLWPAVFGTIGCLAVYIAGSRLFEPRVGLFSALAIASVLQFFITLFPHWNVRTPNWAGDFIQRPEEHILHHQRGVHAGNYSDWPFWDKAFGTYRAPVEEPIQVGFATAGFLDPLKMLAFIDVNASDHVNRGRIEGTSFGSAGHDSDVICRSC